MKKFITAVVLVVSLSGFSSLAIAETSYQDTLVMANQGYAMAQFNIGVMYDKGDGVLQDYAQAMTWFKKAANQGQAAAQFNIGSMYNKGDGVLQDYAQAMTWFKKAANQSHAAAQYNIGVMYYNGNGVPQDKKIAKEWVGKACDNGKQDGCSKYNILNEQGY